MVHSDNFIYKDFEQDSAKKIGSDVVGASINRENDLKYFPKETKLWCHVDCIDKGCICWCCTDSKPSEEVKQSN
ncbi:MAG: hypothetical protein R3321_15145 [Nitrososphaeraceae archaeon]|nr:hypothetical protein [Nitrososphaeraceae archaeon]